MPNVIVTGGSRGLGLGIATTLRAAGHDVIAIARRESGALTSAIQAAPMAEPGYAPASKAMYACPATILPSLVAPILTFM